MVSHSFLQRIFPIQRLNLELLHGRQILYRLSYEGSPIKSHILMLFDWPEWDWGRRKSISCCDGSFWISCLWGRGRGGGSSGQPRYLSSCTSSILSLQRPAVCLGAPYLSPFSKQFLSFLWSCSSRSPRHEQLEGDWLSLLSLSWRLRPLVKKIMVTSFKRSHACTATLSSPSPAVGHHQPTPPLETPGHSQASLA